MEGLTCGVIVILIMAVIGIFGGLALQAHIRNSQRVRQRLNDAFENYRQTLDLLKQQPNNPEIRQRALEWGRHYSNLTRSSQGVTVYDELAVANDINAACAGAVQLAGDSAAKSTQSIEDRLGRLKALLDSGAISEQEYRERRAKLLDEV